MPEKPLIVHWIWNLSLGGDAKNLCALAVEQSKWARLAVFTRSMQPGIRATEFARMGVDIRAAIADETSVRTALASERPVAAIVHRNGRTDPLESEVLRGFVALNIPCFEFNTFGRVDELTDDLWSGHFFPSRSCLLQYALRRGVTYDQLQKHCAPGYCVDIPSRIGTAERQNARKELGVHGDDFVILRLVRPDLRKWDAMPMIALQRLQRESALKCHLIVQSPPPSRTRWLNKTFGASITLLPPSVAAAEIRRTLAAADCLVNYANIGETFGLALAEAMAVGLPAIVNSTPHVDNAQIELCQHNQTGLVANDVAQLRRALELLGTSTELRTSLGSNARDLVAGTFAPSLVEPRIRSFIRAHIERTNPAQAALLPVDAANQDDYVLNDRFVADMHERAKLHVTGSAPNWADEAIVRAWRSRDALEYAINLGPKNLANTIARRARKLSLRRD